MSEAVNLEPLLEVDGLLRAGGAAPDASPAGLRARLAFWLRNDASRLLWPTRCLACDDPGGEVLDLCPACAAGLPWLHAACRQCALPLPLPLPLPSRPPAGSALCGACLARPSPLAAVHAAFVYATPLDRLLPRFKFHQDLASGRLLAQLMAEAFAVLPRPPALVPVPLHPARLRRRGYDQALELARPLARALQIPLHAHLLRRVRNTSAQSELDAAARRRNLRDAFAIRNGAPLPRHVVLVDDVMTTGATLQAAALTLRRAGVQRVEAWVCARVP